MIKIYLKNQKQFFKKEELESKDINNIIWIDILSPSQNDINFMEKTFSVIMPDKQDSEEIESSSRYWEENDQIEINSFFLISDEKYTKNETVSFILKDNFLISVRYCVLKTFQEVEKKYLISPKLFKSGSDVLSNILDIRIDTDADAIEQLSKDISKIRKLILNDYKNGNEELLEKISKYEDINMKIRENILDKQRILSAILKSPKFNEDLKEEFKVMIRDVRSLIEYTQFNFERLEYLHNTFIGVLKIEQNKVIKIFTVINVMFLPPTLIASIYGMNFIIMPELEWGYGYLFSIILMVLSAVIPVFIFKKKGWF